MIEWYWAYAVGVAALIAGYLLGKRMAGRSAEPELTAAREDLAQARERSTAATDRVKALEHELAAAVGRAEAAEQEADRVAPQLAGLSSSIAELKQHAADDNTARRAAEAAMASKEAERQKAVDQAGIAKQAAAEASDKYDAITAEFVSLKRALREALDGISRTERERDAMATEASVVAARASADVAEAERAQKAAVADAYAERDAAIIAAEAATQRRADAGTLRSEIMSAQRELADLREELARKDRHIRDLEGSRGRPIPGSDPVVEAFAGFDPEAGSAVSDAEMEAAVDAAPGPDTALDGGDAGTDTDDESDLESLDDDDNIFTVDDLPGGDWEPDQPIIVEAESGTGANESVATGSPAPESVEPDLATDDHGSADNLRLIKGIGPKFETLLQARNITSFSQIAALTDDTEWETYLDTFAGRIEREQWREQAVELLNESRD